MKYILPVNSVAHTFSAHDLVGGDAALDFINTATGRDVDPRDWLDDYSRLLQWAGVAGLLPSRTLRALAAMAKKDPASAGKALMRARELRETMFLVMAAIIAGRAPASGALALLRQYWLQGAAAHELRFAGGRVLPVLRNDAVDLDLIAALVAYRMIEDVLPTPKERLRICHGANCSWLFIDSSKAGRRRWCDMAVCGNTAKSRRFLARAQGE